MVNTNWNVKLPLGSVVVDHFLGMKPHPVKCQATYVWIDGTGEYLRSKTRTLPSTPSSIRDYPIWNFDGSSTGQSSGNESDLYLKPVANYLDPFLGGPNRLVLCETYDKEKKPTATNNRVECLRIMEEIASEEPSFGMEQEYLLLDRDGYPLGWPKNGFPAPQGPYYCGIGADRVFGREVVETHYRACLLAGLDICGSNAEVTPGQWEFQLGIIRGIEMGDQLWMARYLLHRVAEQFGVLVSLDPKPNVTAKGEWNAAGCHTNFSTKKMRSPGGFKLIEEAMQKLSLTHDEHLKVYDPHQGVDNLKRLSGKLETSSTNKFTWGVADRNCSVRIPRQVAEEGCGYLEDRRPASNCDPYSVIGAIAKTILLK